MKSLSKPALCVFAICTCAAQAVASSPTLQKVRQAGVLLCGVVQEDAEYSTDDNHGTRGDFDGDLCKAFAVAALGPNASLKVVDYLDSESARDALRTGKVDVVATIASTPDHPQEPGIYLTRPIFYDGVGLLVPKAAGIASVGSLAGKKICFLAETDVEESLHAYFVAHQLDLLPFPFQEEGEMEAAYITNNCVGLAGDLTRLVNTRITFGSLAKSFELLPGAISIDPMSTATRDDDKKWSAVVSAVLDTLIAAERYGVTATTPTTAINSQSLLAQEQTVAPAAGLSPGWTSSVIRAVGNYSEMYERSFGPASGKNLPRGMNRLVVNGGLLAQTNAGLSPGEYKTAANSR